MDDKQTLIDFKKKVCKLFSLPVNDIILLNRNSEIIDENIEKIKVKDLNDKGPFLI